MAASLGACAEGATSSYSQAPFTFSNGDGGSLAEAGAFQEGVPGFVSSSGNAILPVNAPQTLATTGLTNLSTSSALTGEVALPGASATTLSTTSGGTLAVGGSSALNVGAGAAIPGMSVSAASPLTATPTGALTSPSVALATQGGVLGSGSTAVAANAAAGANPTANSLVVSAALLNQHTACNPRLMRC